MWKHEPRPDLDPEIDPCVLPKLADALGVSIEAILDVDAKATRRTRAGGQVQQAFDEVRRLPRRQQQKVVEFVFAFVNEHNRKAA